MRGAALRFFRTRRVQSEKNPSLTQRLTPPLLPPEFYQKSDMPVLQVRFFDIPVSLLTPGVPQRRFDERAGAAKQTPPARQPVAATVTRPIESAGRWSYMTPMTLLPARKPDHRPH
jgi:hypothetical protein